MFVMFPGAIKPSNAKSSEVTVEAGLQG
uniref:Uncharacterized protein n=1 Tax=Medicago truncatula TaxID=3880 RepID=I3T177_MEDTR|nr:unknown [Medicago truncatula]